MNRSIELELWGGGKWGALVSASVTVRFCTWSKCLADELMNNEVEGVMPVCHLRGAFLGSLHDLPRCGKEEVHHERRSLTKILLMSMNS